jgi:hypothetical protein
MNRCNRRTFLLATGLAALPLLMKVTTPPAGAAMERIAELEGRLVQLSAVSVGIVEKSSGKVVHFLLEPHFDEAYTADEKKLIPMNELRMNSIVKIIYDLNTGGPRRADRIIILKRG